MNLVVHMVYLHMGAAQGGKPYAGASEPNGWGMGLLALLNFALSETEGKTHQMWFFYMLAPQSFLHSDAPATSSYPSSLTMYLSKHASFRQKGK